MDLFEFVLAGLSIVFGLALTKFLEGIVKIARQWRGRRLHWVHAVWIGISFLWLARGWWQLWGLRDVPTWDFAAFLMVLMHASTMFVWLPLIVVLDDDVTYPDGKAFYYGVKDDFFRWGIVHLIAYVPFVMAVSEVLDVSASIWGILVPGLIWTALMFAAWKTNRGWFHAVWALANAAVFVGVILDPAGGFRLG